MVTVTWEQRAVPVLGAKGGQGDEEVLQGGQWETCLVSRRCGPVHEHIFFFERMQRLAWVKKEVPNISQDPVS